MTSTVPKHVAQDIPRTVRSHLHGVVAKLRIQIKGEMIFKMHFNIRVIARGRFSKKKKIKN